MLMSTLSNVSSPVGDPMPTSIGLIPDTIPAAKSVTGVSVEYVPTPGCQWYVFRASYGRENKAAEEIIAGGTYAYVAKRVVKKTGPGRPKLIHKSLIPNLLFVYTTADAAETYIKNTPTLNYLTYYYNHCEENDERKNPPLIIPCKEMENFIRATSCMSEHLRLVEPSQCHYRGGETVVVTEGIFKGVMGKVARVSGQQRIIVNLTKVGMIATAYIPTAFIQRIDV